MLSKAYDPKPVEDKWVKRWHDAGLFAARARKDRSDGEPFVIVIPPPNITGSLHMGHALNNVLQDSLVRFHRMLGREALWVPGTDHGGIATQNVVEKMLKAEGKSRHDLGREKFLERMWAWRKQVGDTILMQLTRLGCSLDFSRKRFTMEDPCAAAVYEAFKRLWEKGVVYRGERMINWCVRCHTALSDIEVEPEERKGKLWHIKYPGEGGHGVVVATTRPETMLGDTAVAVAPGSHKWKHLVGKKVKLPLTDRMIPVIEDAAIDAGFGQGALKVTPAHDPTDFEIGQRHNLPSIRVIGFEGKMTPEAGAKYAGLSREKARDQVLADLEAEGLIERVEDHPHSVPTCYRCGNIVEPLVSNQWFVRMQDLAVPAAEAARSGRVRFHPESWKGPYVQWLENIRDWCISRQIWWGHRIPVWYCLECNDISGKSFLELSDLKPTVSVEKPKKCANCGSQKGNFEQDPDVLDTWFSSGLWPFSVFGWPKKTEDLGYFYPTTVLVTGYEILYLWVARMVMMGLEFMSKEPFEHVFIHGIVRDKGGKKMSKSLGNVVDPLVLMEKFGTDATRFSLITQAAAGRDIPFAEDSPVGARNFANKIWNSTRFVLMNLPEKAEPIRLDRKGLELADRWILSEYSSLCREVPRLVGEYKPAEAAALVYEFLWDKFCDWYIELAKIRLAQEGAGKRKAQEVLVHVLSGTLKLLHPFMPFITEELWQELRPFVGGGEFLLNERLPVGAQADEEAENNMEIVQDATVAIRTARSLLNIPPGQKLEALGVGGDDEDRSILEKSSDYVCFLARLASLNLSDAGPKPPKTVTAVARGISFYLPLEGIDAEKERARLAKDFEKVSRELEHWDRKLQDRNFMEKASEDARAAARRSREQATKDRERLKETLDSLG